MIYAATKLAKESDFIVLLDKTKNDLNRNLVAIKKMAPLDFENNVRDEMRTAAIGTIFEGKIKQTGPAAFPDIVANDFFGVEVKMTAKDSWTSTGNSVLESSRIAGIERIYIMFGKFGGSAEIRFRLYQECLPEISVTHSPRYRIDMELPKGKSIFDKMKIDYDVLRKEPKSIQTIKAYYRGKLKADEELWWIDQESVESSVSPIIRSFKNFKKEEKVDFEVEAMIFFPEIFGAKQAKYERLAAYLITSRNAVSANLRDQFSASGRGNILMDGKAVKVKKIFFKLFNNAKKIEKSIKSIAPEKLAYYWRVERVNDNPLGQWKELIDANMISVGEPTAGEVFDAGLK